MSYANRADRQQAIREKALEMGLSENTVKRRKIVEKTLETTINRAEKHQNAQKHRENCEKLAKMVINRQIRLKEGVERSGLSERQFQRWIARVKGEMNV
jgi:hypothetical protein